MRAAWLIVGLSSVLAIGACRPGVPVVDPGPKPPTMDGTISGTVRGPQGGAAVVGREVQVVNVDTGERQRVTTNESGGFTFKVKPGKYRVEVSLMNGESLLKQPGVMNVNRSDVDAHADFIVGAARTSRPQSPSSVQGDSRLAPPIA
jgi:hypothetical protein